MRLKVCLFVLFFWRAHAKKGETVLIHGASGAVSVWKKIPHFSPFLSYFPFFLKSAHEEHPSPPPLPFSYTHTESVYHTHTQQFIWLFSWAMHVELHSNFILFKISSYSENWHKSIATLDRWDLPPCSNASPWGCECWGPQEPRRVWTWSSAVAPRPCLTTERRATQKKSR